MRLLHKLKVRVIPDLVCETGFSGCGVGEKVSRFYIRHIVYITFLADGYTKYSESALTSYLTIREGPGRHSAFADLEYQGKKRKTRRELFLERMESLIPWQKLEDLIGPYPLPAMLRVHSVQLFYNLSDPGMEALLYKSDPVRMRLKRQFEYWQARYRNLAKNTDRLVLLFGLGNLLTAEGELRG